MRVTHEECHFCMTVTECHDEPFGEPVCVECIETARIRREDLEGSES